VDPIAAAFDVVEETIEVAARRLSIIRPRSSEELLDEEAFDREEFLPYWAELWPSALALAEVAAEHVRRGLRVLELGCGLAVPSVVAALAGGRVLATDWSPASLLFAAENARRNGAELETELVRWDDAHALAGRAPWDLVLASDVLYERRNVELLLGLLPGVVAPGGLVLLADPGRPHVGAFLAAAEASWRVEPVEPFGEPFVVALAAAASAPTL
jgi:predicted nicotinamide N-methyase